MRRCLWLAILGLLATSVTGCGSSATQTVTGASASLTSSTTTTRSQTQTTTSASVSSSTAAQTSTATTTTTRTASAPAFLGHEGASGMLANAITAVHEHGYTPSDTSQFHSGQTLAVLVGTRTGSADGYDQRAFFFLDGKYIGNDSSQPSATLRVLAQSDTEVTLAYPLYRPHDSLCCPGGGQAVVHFQLNNGKLVALGKIPPASSTTSTSRQ